VTHEEETALSASAELMKEINEEPQCPICGAPLELEVEHLEGRPCRKLNDAFAKVGESIVLDALARTFVFCLCVLALVGCTMAQPIADGDADQDDAQAFPSGDGGAMPDARPNEIDAGQDAGPIARSAVCAEIDRLDGALGCMLPKGPDGSACPPSWAPVCAGPHADWCLNDLRTQVDSCTVLQLILSDSGECGRACAS
jgi:hypothetical protein